MSVTQTMVAVKAHVRTVWAAMSAAVMTVINSVTTSTVVLVLVRS